MEKRKMYAVVKVFPVGHPNSLVVTIPIDARREMGIKKGKKYAAYGDGSGRLIYEPLEGKK